MAFSIQNLASAHLLGDLALSPDASKVVYRVGTAYKTGDHQTASIWYSSDTTKVDSARQLTSGLYDDGSPAWNATSDVIYFLSDRHKQEGPKQMYAYSLDVPGEPSLLNEAFKAKKRGVEQFQVSPNGRYIAFRSADEPTPEEEQKDKDKDDARVWGERKGYVRLRLYTIGTGEVRTLFEGERHVDTFTWSPDSKELLCLVTNRSDLEARFEPTSVFTVSILPSSNLQAKHLADIERAPYNNILWPSPFHADFYSLHSYVPGNLIDSLAVRRYSPDPKSTSLFSNTTFYLGEATDAFSLVGFQSQDGEFAVGIAYGVDTGVDIVNYDGKIFTLYRANKRAWLSMFDVKKVGDEYVMACIRSSSPNKEGPNIWVGRTGEKHSLRLTTKLSTHNSWIEKHKLGSVEVFEWNGEDGVALDGMAWFPQGHDSSSVKEPLPTILHVHGGPYGRDVPSLQPSFLSWQSLLAEQGYLVLCPNYRGSSGRGHAFALAAHHGMGSIEWSDVNGMVDEAVKRGLADKEKLAIGGWSQGGFMTAWGVSQTKNKFRCGVMGAGVSDWGSLAAESDLPDFEAELGGTAPWIGHATRLAGDPIRHVKDIETAILILHGECDARVTVGQGIGFHRGLRRMSKYPDRHTLVVYPREGHIFSEKKHVEDVLKRVIEHYEAWLK